MSECATTSEEECQQNNAQLDRGGDAELKPEAKTSWLARRFEFWTRGNPRGKAGKPSPQ